MLELFATHLISLSLSSRLDAILQDATLKNGVVSACVWDADGKTLYSKDSDRRLVPASNQKLITTMYAVDRLGIDFQSKTRFWNEDNAIIVSAEGDPGMSTAQLQTIQQRLGGKKPVVKLQQAYWPGVHPDWEVGDLPNRYAAPVTALTVDRGSFELWAGGRKPISLPSELGVAINFSPTSKSASWKYAYSQCKVNVSGKLPADQTFLEAFALPKPDQSAARFLGSSVVATDSVPLRSPDWTESSRPLGEMVRHCLTMSDNFYAENFLLLTAAREKAVGRENAWQTAADQASKWLQNEVKWKGALPRIDDGSGLSRQNYVSASGFAQLLLWARSRSWFKQYYDCLVTPGSGTLKGRLPGSTFHGKTGTLSGVQSLSGYVVDANGKQLIISVIVNNSSANTQKLRDVLDKFVIQCESGIIDGTNFASSSNSYAVHARTVPFTRSYSVAIHRSR